MGGQRVLAGQRVIDRGLTCLTPYQICVHKCPRVYRSYHVCMPATTSVEIGIRELRATMSEVLNDTAVRGRITYVTSHGRRVAAIVPVPEAEAIEEKRQAESAES